MQQTRSQVVVPITEKVARRRAFSIDRLIPVLMITPSILAIAIFVYGFIGWNGIVSFTKWVNINPDFSFNGFENYATIFSTPRFQTDIRNTIVFTVLFLVGCLVVGLMLAVFLDSGVRGESIFRTIYLFPMALSFVVTGTVWQWLFASGTPQEPTGLNLLFHNIGFDVFQNWSSPTGPQQTYAFGWSVLPEWLKTRIGLPLPMIPVVIAAVWQMSGFTMAMYLAGLRGIPEELREAARVDGASELQLFRYITLPLLQPITLSVVIILGHISLKIFDLIMTQTGGGPGNATDVPGIFMYEITFKSNNYAQGAAVAVVMLLIIAVLIVPYLINARRTETDR